MPEEALTPFTVCDPYSYFEGQACYWRHRAYRSLIRYLIPSDIYASTGPCPVMPRDTFPMIVSLSPTLERDYCVPLTRGRWLSRTSSFFGDTTFAAAAIGVWNSLPDSRNAELSRFRRSLKTFLFRQSDHGALIVNFSFFKLRLVDIFVLTYLLMDMWIHHR